MQNTHVFKQKWRANNNHAIMARLFGGLIDGPIGSLVDYYATW
jgi:hypothetical protein